jgi:hypothetical protein
VSFYFQASGLRKLVTAKLPNIYSGQRICVFCKRILIS